MASVREAPAFHAQLSVSKRFVCLLSLAHAGALAIGVAMSVAIPLLTPLCLAMAASWVWTLRRDALLKSARSYVALEINDERSVALQMRCGGWIYGELKPSTYVLPWLIILDVAAEKRWFGTRVVLFPDSMTQDAHRRLRTRLRWAHYRDKDMDAPDASL